MCAMWLQKYTYPCAGQTRQTACNLSGNSQSKTLPPGVMSHATRTGSCRQQVSSKPVCRHQVVLARSSACIDRLLHLNKLRVKRACQHACDSNQAHALTRSFACVLHSTCTLISSAKKDAALPRWAVGKPHFGRHSQRLLARH
jgi:hypothetical protein